MQGWFKGNLGGDLLGDFVQSPSFDVDLAEFCTLTSQVGRGQIIMPAALKQALEQGRRSGGWNERGFRSFRVDAVSPGVLLQGGLILAVEVPCYVS